MVPPADAQPMFFDQKLLSVPGVRLVWDGSYQPDAELDAFNAFNFRKIHDGLHKEWGHEAPRMVSWMWKN